MNKITVRVFSIAIAMILLFSACGTAAAPEPETASAAPAESTPASDNVTPDAEPETEEPAEQEEPEGEVVLTMAVVHYFDFMNLSSKVEEFNNQSDKYKIELKDYSDMGEYDFEKAKMKLYVDIGSGNVPDMINFSDLSPYTFVSRGYLLDMTPYVEADEDISLEDISTLKALTKQGGLYFISDSFALSTGCAKYSEFGDRYGWTMDEYLEIDSSRASNAETTHNMTRENFLEYNVSRYVADSIDWSNGTCDLNNDTFKAILESGARMRETPEDTSGPIEYTPGVVQVAQGRLVMAMEFCTNPAALAYDEHRAGEKLSFIGRPTIDGSNGSDIALLSPIGICTYTKSPKGCWEFIKYLLTGFDKKFGMPMYKPLLMDEIEKAKVEVLEQDDARLFGESVLMTDEDAERLLDLLEDTEHLWINDEAVMDIVKEEAMAYFNGGTTVERAAELIQSRVQLYVSEQS